MFLFGSRRHHLVGAKEREKGKVAAAKVLGVIRIRIHSTLRSRRGFLEWWLGRISD
jgi:hypothetical protein